MTLNCKHVWAQISSYIDGSVTPEMKQDIERHLAHCRYCSAVLDSTRNILVLVGDDRTFELPVGYSKRLHDRLQASMDSTDSSS